MIKSDSVTFYQWLKQQRHRNDFIGDLARDAQWDENRKPSSAHGWLKYLENANACDGALAACKSAAKEFEATRRTP